LRLADLAAASQSAPEANTQPVVWLVDASDLRFALEPQAGVVRIGRAADNDVVIGNQRVSRYHAQLRWVESSWLVYDLDSTNGTFVDEQRVGPSQPVVLAPGTRLRLGDHDLRVNAHSPGS
jgi:predicted component of type VI protein secretion system